jgi:hypothetical protein
VYRLKFGTPLQDCLVVDGSSAHSLQGVALLSDLPSIAVSALLLLLFSTIALLFFLAENCVFIVLMLQGNPRVE